MTENTTTRNEPFRVVGIGIAACAACCAGPILAVLGGLSVVGTIGSLFVGAAGIAVAMLAGAAYLGVRRRSTEPSCSTDSEPVRVAPPSRRT